MASNLKRRLRDVAKKEMPPTKLVDRIEEALSHSYPIGPGPEGTYVPVYLPAWEIPLDDERYRQALESVIKKLAESQLIVIRGRGSQFILKDHPNTLHILTLGPLELRVKRVMAATAADEVRAKKEIDCFDKSRREFIRRYFYADLENPQHCDLVINTRSISYDDSASVILDALPSKKHNVMATIMMTLRRSMSASLMHKRY